MPSDELDDYMVDLGTPDGFDVQEQISGTAERTFVLNNDDDALWAMRSFAQATRRLADIDSQAQRQISRVNDWKASVGRSHEAKLEYFKGILTSYMLRVRDDATDGRKSLAFPDGDITSRPTQPSIKVEDLDAFIAWAESSDHSDWLRVKKEPDIKSIKPLIDIADDAIVDPATGSIVEGLTAVEGGMSVTFKVHE